MVTHDELNLENEKPAWKLSSASQLGDMKRLDYKAGLMRQWMLYLAPRKDLTGTCLKVFCLLCLALDYEVLGEIKQSDVAGVVNIHPSDASKAFKKLEQIGFLEKSGRKYRWRPLEENKPKDKKVIVLADYREHGRKAVATV